MEWFSLEGGVSYKQAWSKCPDEVLEVLRSIPEFNLPENKAKFKSITGLDL
jgi:hypothetical protein